jgi:peroxiredoxin
VKETILYLLLGAVIVGAAGFGAVRFLAPRPVDAGDDAPNFVVSEHGGEGRELSSYRGRAVLLFVARTDCDRCLRQLSGLAWLSRRFGARGLEVLVLFTDSDPAAADPIAVNFAGSFTMLDDPDGQAVKKALGVDAAALPVAYLLDAQGAVVQKYDGFVNWADPTVRDLILTILPPAPPRPEPEPEPDAS